MGFVIDIDKNGMHRSGMVGKSEQVAIRLDLETIEAIDALRELLSKQVAGTDIQRSAVIRAALVRGLAVMKAELAGAKPKRRK